MSKRKENYKEKFMANVIFNGWITSDFEGFDYEKIFEMSDGSTWQQAEYKYWYHYAYMPKAQIISECGRTVLNVEGNSVSVTRL